MKSLWQQERKKKKLKRNDPCYCGSEEKYKNCHFLLDEGNRFAPKIPPKIEEELARRFAKHQQEERERVERYGQIRPLLSTKFNDRQMIVVGNTIHHSKTKSWKFFPDFLHSFVPTIFGKDWGEAELAKPENERHPIVQWRGGAITYLNAQKPDADGVYKFIGNGFTNAYMYFAYDLYTVADNGRLDDLLLKRLKNRDLFQGARHELFAEATCLRAGFTIEHEDETDGNSRHAEFTARHKENGQLLSVEAKSKHHAGVIAMPGPPQSHEKLSLRFGHFINGAVAKKPKHPLVIFIDTNLPKRAAEKVYVPQSWDPLVPSRIMAALLDRVKKEHGGVDPYALLVFTNHPYHYAAPDELDLQRQLFAVHRPSAVKHPMAIMKLELAANMYGNVPNEFPKEESRNITV